MGDRANVAIKGNDGTIYLYTHWKGEELPKIVSESLGRGRERWGDVSYLRRIILCDLIKGQERELTGFGISTEIGDNEHPILIVDTTSFKVSLTKEKTPGITYGTCSFNEFVEDYKSIPWK